MNTILLPIFTDASVPDIAPLWCFLVKKGETRYRISIRAYTRSKALAAIQKEFPECTVRRTGAPEYMLLSTVMYTVMGISVALVSLLAISILSYIFLNISVVDYIFPSPYTKGDANLASRFIWAFVFIVILSSTFIGISRSYRGLI